ncbi:unnamed protein product, partial [Rotaria sp. Silwood1]
MHCLMLKKVFEITIPFAKQKSASLMPFAFLTSAAWGLTIW